MVTRHWVDFHIKSGNLVTHRQGTAKNSKKYLSRMDILALKQAERITNKTIYIK